MGTTTHKIRRAFTNQLRKTLSHACTPPPKVESLHAYLQYVRGTTENIGRILKKQYTEVLKSIKKVGQMLTSAKDKEISFEFWSLQGCDDACVGEKWRQVISRVWEHMKHTKKGGTEKSSIPKDSCEYKHHILFERTANGKDS